MPDLVYSVLDVSMLSLSCVSLRGNGKAGVEEKQCAHETLLVGRVVEDEAMDRGTRAGSRSASNERARRGSARGSMLSIGSHWYLW